MTNNFVIKKGLIVSGSDLQPLNVQGTTGQLFNVASSSQGNIFLVNTISGLPLIKVSGSTITLGVRSQSGSIALDISQSSAQITGSAHLTAASLPAQLTQGNQVTASGQFSHAQGFNTTASGNYSHTEGVTTQATNIAAHAEGTNTQASAIGSHAQGVFTTTQGLYAHAEGRSSEALGSYSHTQGFNTTASVSYQHVTGQFNNTSTQPFAFIHGNGIDNANRTNLIHAYGSGSNGVVEISGSLRVNGSITGSISTQISQQTIDKYTLAYIDSGQEFLFRNNCDITIPSGIQQGFLITLNTVDTVAYILTGSGVVLINNKGTTIPMKASATIINTGTQDEYLVLGDL